MTGSAPPRTAYSQKSQRRRSEGRSDSPRGLQPVQPEWAAPLDRIARLAELPYTPVFGRLAERPSIDVLAGLRALGATLEAVPGCSYWEISENARAPFLRQAMPEATRERLALSGFFGAFSAELDDVRYLITRGGLLWQDQVVIGAPDLQSLLDVTQRVAAAAGDLKRSTVQFPAGTTRELPPVEQEDLVLETRLRTELMGFLGAFERRVRSAERMGLSVHAGLLLVGPPGTGKTMAVRHILTRFASYRRYVYITDPARDMREAALSHLAEALDRHPAPAVAVIEDIDRILESQAVTPQYLLNLLDGMLRPSCSVLWVATSNDPSALEDNLLDRPGRFDRVLHFDVPGLEEREELIRRFTRGLAEPATVRGIAASSAGLTGAHLCDLCESALIDAEDGPLQPVLQRELARVLEHHRSAGRVRRQLGGNRSGIGFEAAR